MSRTQTVSDVSGSIASDLPWVVSVSMSVFGPVFSKRGKIGLVVARLGPRLRTDLGPAEAAHDS